MLSKDKIEGIDVIPDNAYFGHFFVKLRGPKETPYENGTFDIEILLSDDYPMSPPKVLFITKIFHPNIDKLGRICLDVLKDKWTPALQIRSVLLSIQVLMGNPDPEDFLDIEAADLWKKDPKSAIKKAREWTQKYAML